MKSVGFYLTAGQASDIGQAENLLALTPEGADALVAEKGYDSDAFVQAIDEKGSRPSFRQKATEISLALAIGLYTKSAI